MYKKPLLIVSCIILFFELTGINIMSSNSFERAFSLEEEKIDIPIEKYRLNSIGRYFVINDSKEKPTFDFTFYSFSNDPDKIIRFNSEGYEVDFQNYDFSFDACFIYNNEIIIKSNEDVVYNKGYFRRLNKYYNYSKSQWLEWRYDYLEYEHNRFYNILKEKVPATEILYYTYIYQNNKAYFEKKNKSIVCEIQNDHSIIEYNYSELFKNLPKVSNSGTFLSFEGKVRDYLIFDALGNNYYFLNSQTNEFYCFNPTVLIEQYNLGEIEKTYWGIKGIKTYFSANNFYFVIGTGKGIFVFRFTDVIKE